MINNKYISKCSLRRFIVTINNEPRTDIELYDYIANLDHIKYFIFQREKCNKTGNEIIVAFLIFSISKRFSTIYKYFPSADIQKCWGPNELSRAYCSKDGARIGEVMEYQNLEELSD